MFHSELVATTSLDPRFHAYVEQITGVNSATIVQRNRRPRSEHAYVLAYFRAFNDPAADTSDVKTLFGMAHFTILSAGPEIEMAEVTSSPHGLRCLASPVNRRGVVAVLFAGDGEQWASAIRNAGSGSVASQEWGRSCHQQFAKHNLDDLMGKIKPTIGTQYLLGN